MNHGTKVDSHSDLNEERTKMGTDLKAMGKMTVRTGDVRRTQTKMGDRQSVQMDQEVNVDEVEATQTQEDQLRKENEELMK